LLFSVSVLLLGAIIVLQKKTVPHEEAMLLYNGSNQLKQSMDLEWPQDKRPCPDLTEDSWLTNMQWKLTSGLIFNPGYKLQFFTSITRMNLPFLAYKIPWYFPFRELLYIVSPQCVSPWLLNT
jgi:hypothetical protein